MRENGTQSSLGKEAGVIQGTVGGGKVNIIKTYMRLSKNR